MQITERKQQILDELQRVRQKTLRLLDQVPIEFWNVRVHDFYSPIGWHFGHIGMTEEQWTCVRAFACRPRDLRLSFLFANIPENPKERRVRLPEAQEVKSYLYATRDSAVDALCAADLTSDGPLLADGYAWEFAIQHECQHQETICELLQLIRHYRCTGRSGGSELEASPAPAGERRSGRAEPQQMVSIAGGTFLMGSDDLHGYDNEKRAHRVDIASFELDKYPVTVGDWIEFIRANGYGERRVWSDPGWEWRETQSINLPEYWIECEAGRYAYSSADRMRMLDPCEPVSSLSWYEADAYARWVGKRLPTEAEWEFAAAYDPSSGRIQRFPWGDDPTGAHRFSCEIRRWQPEPIGPETEPNSLGLCGMAGGVWEWTSTPFLPYPSFVPFPYEGYSKEHMDGKHFVCRGGSWATDRRILRTSFRNWYVPTYRQGFLGLRCAR